MTTPSHADSPRKKPTNRLITSGWTDGGQCQITDKNFDKESIIHRIVAEYCLEIRGSQKKELLPNNSFCRRTILRFILHSATFYLPLSLIDFFSENSKKKRNKFLFELYQEPSIPHDYIHFLPIDRTTKAKRIKKHPPIDSSKDVWFFSAPCGLSPLGRQTFSLFPQFSKW